jgi:hypothetical protein
MHEPRLATKSRAKPAEAEARNRTASALRWGRFSLSDGGGAFAFVVAFLSEAFFHRRQSMQQVPSGMTH